MVNIDAISLTCIHNVIRSYPSISCIHSIYDMAITTDQEFYKLVINALWGENTDTPQRKFKTPAYSYA